MQASNVKDGSLRRPEYAALALVLGLVLVAIWGVAFRNIRQVNHAAYQSALATVEHHNNQLALQWEAKLAYIDSLHVRAREITRMVMNHNPSASERIEELKDNLSLTGDDFEAVSGFDAKGRLIWSTAKMLDPNLSIADREYFQDVAIRGKDHAVGSPLLGRMVNQWTIPFLEATRDADGALIFATTVGIKADLIKSMTRFFDPNIPFILTLVRKDSRILTREPPSGIGGQNQQRKQLIETALTAGSTSGLEVSPLDGVRRIFAFRLIPGSDLLVHVAMDEDVALTTAHKWEHSTIWWSIVLSIVSVVLLVSWALAFQYKRVSRARRLVLQRAVDNEALLTRFAAKASDLIALFDHDFNYIFVNPAFETKLGFSASQLLGKRLGTLAVWKRKDVLDAELAALIKEMTSKRVLSELENARGELVWLDSEFVAITDENRDGARAAYYMATARDVTQQMEARKELLRMQEHVATLLRSGSGILGTATVDMSGRKLSETLSPLSPNYEQILAAAARRGVILLKGKVLDKDLPRLQEAYQRCIAEGHAVIELSAFDDDGSLHHRRAQLVLAERHAETCEIVIYAYDITKEHASRRRMELVERLATLGEITTHLAHELAQPVATILMICENGLRRLARDPSNLTDATNRLERIKLVAVRLGEIIHNVRRFGRSDAETRQQFELAELLQEVEILASSRLASVGARLDVQASPELPALNVPRLGLAQVLVNLVANACDAYEANPVARPVISVSASLKGHTMQVSVADAAGGIPAELLDRVFDNFFTTKAPGKGTGVGLSISRTLMREMGGDLQVENARDGAVFTLTIPLVGTLGAPW